jgi:hypothetical protein
MVRGKTPVLTMVLKMRTFAVEIGKWQESSCEVEDVQKLQY